MSESKMQKLIEAARRDPAPTLSSGFESQVMRAIKSTPSFAPSVLDLLGAAFPRVAIASAMLIGICLAGDSLLSKNADMLTGISEISQEWPLSVEDIPL